MMRTGSPPRVRPSRTRPALWVWGVLGVGALIGYLQVGGRSEPRLDEPTPWYGYRIVNVYPHDREAFTQGLIFRDGFLFESTGLNGRSSLRRVRLETGEVVQQIPVDARYFAEGLTDSGNGLVQLTWQSNVGFVYDLSTFALRRTFSYPGEGWGLARDKNRLVMSDGTATLRFLDPETQLHTGRLTVMDGVQPVSFLNELEVVKGEILANVWRTEHIVMISPETGRVTGKVDLHGLLASLDRTEPVDVLNGIAYDAGHDRLFVTGKLWPRLFEIQITRSGSVQ